MTSSAVMYLVVPAATCWSRAGLDPGGLLLGLLVGGEVPLEVVGQRRVLSLEGLVAGRRRPRYWRGRALDEAGMSPAAWRLAAVSG
jgi:hypothetical protein